MQDRIPEPSSGDNPALSREHELKLAAAAGRLYAALYPATEDLPQWARSVMAETLADLDEVRGIDTTVVAIRQRAAADIEASHCRDAYDPHRTPGGER